MKNTILFIIGIVIFIAVQETRTAQATGGEVLMLFLPLWWNLVEIAIESFIETIREVL